MLVCSASAAAVLGWCAPRHRAPDRGCVALASKPVRVTPGRTTTKPKQSGKHVMKIGFYLENSGIPEIDLSRPSLGNPGCGGTEYLFAALSFHLAAAGGRDHRPIVFANHAERLPDNLTCFPVTDVLEAARRAKNEGCGLFVYRPRRHPQTEFLALIDRLQLPVVAWTHVTPTEPHLRALAESPHVKAVVCVGREQHDLAWDTPIWPKLTCIANSFDVDGFRLANPPATEPGLVVYLGALVPQKGFHVLAKAWPCILRRHPKARLAVVGSGTLYGEARLGPWNVAAPDYEALFAPHLAGPDGRPHPSVSFLGKLGLEKKDILYRASVGVPNPSGYTENCPGSALEFQACGTAVVSAAAYGLLDTVRHGETGLLGRGENDLVNNVCALLDDPVRAETLGQNGIRFIRETFDVGTITPAWIDLFERLAVDARPRPVPLKRNLHRHAKFLIVFNRPLQMTLGRVVAWPSIIDIKSRMAKLPGFRTWIASRSR